MATNLTKPGATAELQHLPFGSAISDVLAVIERDGGIIIDDILTPEQVAKLNADIDPRIDAINAGSKKVDEGALPDFHGDKTKRLTNLVTISQVFREEIMANPAILDLADAMLGKTSDNIWLTTAQVIELFPGQKTQVLHRDMENYPIFMPMGKDSPEVQINFLIALTDFTEEVGATRVIPGSNRWDDWTDRGTPEQTIPAVMKAGSCLLITGRVIHGGGANRTTDRRRRGLALAYNAGFLVPEEAYPFFVPMEIAKSLPPRAQQLIGFRSFHNASNGGASLWQSNFEEIADQIGLD